MIFFLTTGTILGLSAALTPGPLMTLLISETLRHGMKAGVRVALSPILTDLPIIILTLFILAKLSSFHSVLGVISFLGALFLGFIGYEGLQTKGVHIGADDQKPKSLKKAIIVNALNPHPYLFWFTVGAPIMIRASDQGVIAASAFILSFYVFLVGSKVALAALVGKSRSLLKGRLYIYTMRLLGLALFAFALLVFRDGLNLLGVL